MRILAVAVILSLIACRANTYNTRNIPVKAVQQKTSFKERFAKAAEKIVFIAVYDANGRPFGAGTGFVIGKNGLIATAGHVASKELSTLFVKFKNNGVFKMMRAKVLRISQEHDLAILKIDFQFDSALELAKKEAENDDLIYLAGYPLYKPLYTPLPKSPVLLRGRVFMPYPATRKLGLNKHILLLNINGAYGYSGAPVLNKSLKVIGVFVAVYSGLPGIFSAAESVEYLNRLIEGLADLPATLPAK